MEPILPHQTVPVDQGGAGHINFPYFGDMWPDETFRALPAYAKLAYYTVCDWANVAGFYEGWDVDYVAAALGSPLTSDMVHLATVQLHDSGIVTVDGRTCAVFVPGKLLRTIEEAGTDCGIDPAQLVDLFAGCHSATLRTEFWHLLCTCRDNYPELDLWQTTAMRQLLTVAGAV